MMYRVFLSVLMFMLIQGLLISPLYFQDKAEPELRSDVKKVKGRLINFATYSELVQRPGPIALHQVERYRSYSSVGKAVYEYEFEVDQNIIRSKFLSSWCFLSSCQQMSKINIDGIDSITIFYDPRNPEKNWLFPPPVYSDLEKLLFTLGVMGLISGFLTFIFFRKAK